MKEVGLELPRVVFLVQLTIFNKDFFDSQLRVSEIKSWVPYLKNGAVLPTYEAETCVAD